MTDEPPITCDGSFEERMSPSGTTTQSCEGPISLSGATDELPDGADRRRAVETFDRNLVVTAGAGTGKTTLLVDRILHLLLRNPDPLSMTQIVALTFTNKAANEMKQRLREKLHAYLEADLRSEPDESRYAVQVQVEQLLRQYQLSKDDLDARAGQALRAIERADIGTIHSFASTLLRLYPLEAGVDPQFREDDGKAFERLFQRDWELWLAEQLSLTSNTAAAWRKILKKLKLDEVRALAQCLASEGVELGDHEMNCSQGSDLTRNWLKSLLLQAIEISGHHGEERVNEVLTRSASTIMSEYLNSGAIPNEREPKALYLLEHNINKTLKGWSEDEIQLAQNFVRVAKALCRIDPPLTQLLLEVLTPFAKGFRDNFVAEGFVSFDGLLIRARNLVRDHVKIRAELKRRYLAILVDEFQDTDPVQYEILLYLAEALGNSARNWRDVKLSSGKIFVVGDPKQSIYAFRRADIGAYLEVVENVIEAQGGAECRLTTNFRSTQPIVSVVNAVFRSVMKPAPGIQPPYIEIHPARNQISRNDSALLPPVLIRKIVAEPGDLNAEKARRVEGESLAAWLKDEVLGKVTLSDSHGQPTAVEPKDVALLFRKLTDIHDYLEPLRRRGIRYVVEGERHFYRAREIVDAVNLLRAIDNPHDRLALVGVLRSPLGGATDQMIYDLHTRNLLDYRTPERLTGSEFPQAMAELFRHLAALHVSCRTLPVGEAIAQIFRTLPLTLLAAASFHREQAVLNLEKLRQQGESLGREDASMTFKETIRELEKRVLEVKEEGESVLAEENVDAIRIMSIHRSKGLEFPIVVLAGCHAGTDDRPSRTAETLFDWSSALAGYRVGAVRDLSAIYIAEKNLVRAEAEEKRLLYVAMTRAREHLIISLGPQSRKVTGSFASMLDEAFEGKLSAAAKSEELPIGTTNVHVEILEESLTAPASGKPKTTGPPVKRDWRPFIQNWRRRGAAYEVARRTPQFITPTLLKRQHEASAESLHARSAPASGTASALLVGEIAHRLLQAWDFCHDGESWKLRIAAFIKTALAGVPVSEQDRIQHDLYEMFQRFCGSKIYDELSESNILGREVPLLIPWGGQIMEGIIDLFYEKNGLLYLADFKTDGIRAHDAQRAAEQYRVQAETYCRAAEESLGRSVADFKVIFLRIGEAVSIRPQPQNRQSNRANLHS